MSTEIFYLFVTSVLLAVMWIPYIIGQVTANGMLRPEEYVTLRDPESVPDWARRANRAHLNLVEQFGAFAGLVVVGHLAGVSNQVTAVAAAVFFWARVAHALVMIAGLKFAMIRTIIFTVAFLALLVFAWQIATRAEWLA